MWLNMGSFRQSPRHRRRCCAWMSGGWCAAVFPMTDLKPRWAAYAPHATGITGFPTNGGREARIKLEAPVMPPLRVSRLSLRPSRQVQPLDAQTQSAFHAPFDSSLGSGPPASVARTHFVFVCQPLQQAPLPSESYLGSRPPPCEDCPLSQRWSCVPCLPTRRRSITDGGPSGETRSMIS
jgi:hypothetical protein